MPDSLFDQLGSILNIPRSDCPGLPSIIAIENFQIVVAYRLVRSDQRYNAFIHCIFGNATKHVRLMPRREVRARNQNI